MGSRSAINNHMFLWLRSNIVINSSPLLFFTLSLLFLPLTITTISFISHDVIKTPYDVIKTLAIIIPTFTAATSLIIIRTTRPRLALISAVLPLRRSYRKVKSFPPPLFTTIITQTALTLLSSLVIAFSPLAVIELLGLGFHVNIVIKLFVGSGLRVSFAVLELLYFIAAWGESERRLVEFRGRSFLMVVFGVFRFGPLLLYMSLVAKGSTFMAPFDEDSVLVFLVLVVGRCAVYLLFSLAITLYVVMYTLLYLQCGVARREYQVCGYVDGDEDDGDKVGVIWSMKLHYLMDIVWLGTLLLLCGYQDC